MTKPTILTHEQMRPGQEVEQNLRKHGHLPEPGCCHPTPMTKIPSVEERAEEMMTEIDNLERITQRGMWWVQMSRVNAITTNFANKLTTDRTALLTELREMIDRHDPNVKMNRETNPAYWGNTLRAELDELINPNRQRPAADRAVGLQRF